MYNLKHIIVSFKHDKTIKTIEELDNNDKQEVLNHIKKSLDIKF